MTAIARWHAFLAQIASRHRDVIGEAEADAREVVAALTTGGDPRPLSHRLMAVTSRLQELETRIIDTWHEKVDELIDIRDRPREYAKGQALQRMLADHREELEPRIFAELARRRFAHATATLEPVACGCGTHYTAPPAFRITELRCVVCGALLVYEPSELVQSVAALGTHALAQEAATTEWRAMRAAEHALHDERPPHSLEAIILCERTQIEYWRVYLTARSQLEPELRRDLAHEIRSRMEPWYVTFAAYEQAWVSSRRSSAS